MLLYELLTGTTPFSEKRLRSLGYAEMQRVIAEEEPPRPSTRLTTLCDIERDELAKRRSEDLRSLTLLFRNELDWVVMKALAPIGDVSPRKLTSLLSGVADRVGGEINSQVMTPEEFGGRKGRSDHFGSSVPAAP